MVRAPPPPPPPQTKSLVSVTLRTGVRVWVALIKLEGNWGVRGVWGGLGWSVCASARMPGLCSPKCSKPSHDLVVRYEGLGVPGAVQRNLGITESSKPSPDHSKITIKTKALHFEDLSLQPTLPATIDQVTSLVLYSTVVQ